MENFFNIKKYDYKELKNKTPWIEKYRPKKIDDLIQQDEIKNILKKSLQLGNIPHLLLYGPPGTGKTSAILACCYELFGPKNFSDRVIELNASDERGINIVRTKITDFAKKALSPPDPNYPSPEFKIIILEEADATTIEAQSALRKVIEEYSSTTRFCFVCNYINQIIDPIISRCMKLRFKPIKEDNILIKLNDICSREKLNIDSNILTKINSISKGDIRKSIIILQNLKYISDFKKTNLTINDLYDMVGLVPSIYIKKIYNLCLDSNSNFNIINKQLLNLKKKGYPTDSILFKLNKIVLNDKNLADNIKSKVIINLSNIEKKLNDGADEFIQLLYAFTYIYNLIKYPNNNLNVELFA